MPNINYQGNGGGVPRKTAKIFAKNASTQDMTVFGSTLANNTQYATDLDSLQSSHYEAGWREAIISNLNYPLLSDMNAVQHTVTQQIAYTLQHGVPEWNSATTYYTYDIVNSGGILYISIQDNHTNKAVTNTDYWAEYYNPSWFSQYQIGQIVSSLIPLTNSGLHLLDGALLSADGIYGEFVNYMATLVSTAPDCFTTESDWQDSITNYGVCGKFVYTAPAGQNPATVRLPKITGILEGTIDATALGDLVEAGLPNITGKFDGNVNKSSVLEAFGECHYEAGNTSLTGAFTPITAYQYGTADGDSPATMVSGFNFDASLSNSTYGNSTTVQPQTIKCFYYICVATTVKTDIEVDIDEIATDLNGKADISLSNLNTTGEKHFINKTQITNNILEAPNGILSYSGNVLTAHEGLKCLVPNGRNTDGTLKNFELTLSSDVTRTFTSSMNDILVIYLECSQASTDTSNWTIGYRTAGQTQFFMQPNQPIGNEWTWYDTDNNVWKTNAVGTISNDWCVPLGYATVVNGEVTECVPFNPTSLLSWSDQQQIIGWGIPYYAQQQTIYVNTIYQAKVDGYVYATATNSYMGSMGLFAGYDASNLSWLLAHWGDDYNGNTKYGCVSAFIPRGMYYSIGSTDVETINAHFVPLKGAL